jgi:hypothetical protein
MTQFTAYLRGNNFRPVEAKAAFNELLPGNVLSLEREASNAYDPNAIMVCGQDNMIHLGYVAKEVAIELAPLMDEGKSFVCTVESHLQNSVVLVIDELQAAVDEPAA